MFAPPKPAECRVVWDPERGTAVLVAVYPDPGGVAEGWLACWSLTAAGTAALLGAWPADERSPFGELRCLAAVYDPDRGGILVLGVGEGRAFHAWVLRGAEIERLAVRGELSTHGFSACHDPGNDRVLVLADQTIWELAGAGLKKIVDIGGASGELVYDARGKRVVLVDETGAHVLAGKKLKTIGRLDDGGDDDDLDVLVAAYAPKREAVYVAMGTYTQRKARVFEVRGDAIAAIDDDVPFCAGLTATAVDDRLVGYRSEEIVALTPGGGAEAYVHASVGEVPWWTRLVMSRSLLAFAATDVWTRDGGRWVPLATTGAGPHVSNTSAIAPDARGRIAAVDEDGALFRLDGTAWSKLAAARPGPAAREGAALVAVGDAFVLFGGKSDSGRLLGDTWRCAGGKWTKLSPAAAPPARAGMLGVAIDDAVWLAGGGAVWRFDAQTWTRVGAMPAGVTEFAHAWDDGGTFVGVSRAGATTWAIWRHTRDGWDRLADVAAPPREPGLPEGFLAGDGEPDKEFPGWSKDPVIAVDPVARELVFVESRPVIRTVTTSLPVWSAAATRPRAPVAAPTPAAPPALAAAAPVTAPAPAPAWPTGTLLRYLAAKKPDGISRAGGDPIGMTAATWPRYDGRPMAHVITVAREHIVVPLPDHVAAIAVFVSDLGENEAYKPGNPHTGVVFLTAADVARGVTPASEILGDEVEEVGRAVPLAISPTTYDFEEVSGRPLPDRDGDYDDESMYEEIVSSALGDFFQAQERKKVGGKEVRGFSGPHAWFLQGAETPKGHRTIFWFREELVPGLNCGDGMMYVAVDAACTNGTAWWQC
jgi:hypothetical protein